MDEHSRRVEQLFYAALDLPADRRSTFLHEVCRDDHRLLNDVHELLAHDAEAGSSPAPRPVERWIDRLPDRGSNLAAAGSDAAAGEAARHYPERIGAYRVLGVIGEGGMGVVYRAEQDNPRRSVALKVIKPEFASRQTLRRFEYEASVLGRLQHPSIAQVYEAGTAVLPEGGGRRAYFAMELIEGRTLLEYAQNANLGTRARLELLASICDAVEHAHQKGVIHRDLKPANILVAAGRPKVLDFGVARATDADMQMTTMQTQVGQLVGTVPYMSPEQVAGDPNLVDTRSDVYALGVILYELLTGRLPYDLSNKTVYEAVRVIREDTPTQISAVRAALRGDVETIVGRALEKDRARRYESAAALAGDIRRFLHDEPILARPPSTIYQLRKFAKRNKVLVGGIAAVFVALLAGSAGITVQYFRAEYARGEAVTARGVAEDRRVEAEQARDAAQAARHAEQQAREQAQLEERKTRQVNNLLMSMLMRAQPSAALGHEFTLREALDQVAADLNARAGRLDPQIAGELHMVVGLTYMRLGEFATADPHLVAALELLGAGGSSRRRAEAAIHLAELRARQGRYEAAARLVEQAVSTLRTETGEQSPELAAALHDYAGLLKQLDRLDDAETLLRDVLAMRRARASADQLAQTLKALGAVLVEAGKLPEGESLLREAIDLLGAASRPNQVEIATAWATLGYALAAKGDHAGSRRAFAQALALQHETLPPGHPDLAATLAQSAIARLLAGDPIAAEADLRESLRIRQAVLPAGHWLLANTRSLLGECLARQRRFGEAEPVLLETWQALESSPAPRRRKLEALDRLTLLYTLWERPHEATAWQDRRDAMRVNAVSKD